jgi:mono/diheme cytochrome c family protein
LEVPHGKLAKAHALLELEGIELDPLLPLGKAKKPEKPVKPEKPKPEPVSPAANGLSFVKHVAPVLLTRCGKCHVEQTKGDLNVGTYAKLMKGAGMAGKVIFPGDADGSRLIEVIVSGDMPRGGKLSQNEFDILKKWIADGAKFDGPNEDAPLATLSTATANAKPAEAPMVTEATGKETVSFAREIASVLATNCSGCHGTNQPRQNLNLSTFAGLMKGGDAGPPVTPGESAASLIVQKLKGTAKDGARMPLNRPPLPDEVIAKIETWIKEGAKFDGPDPNANLSQVAALAKAAGATHAELTADRIKAAEATWGTAMPMQNHDTVETDTFYAKGTIGENTLKDLLEKAEAHVPQIAEILGVPQGQPLVKGRFTVFAVKVRYDFDEIAKVILNIESPPKKSTGLWRYTGVDAAGVVMQPKNEADYAADIIIAEQAAAASVAGTGKNVPKWFADGVGRVVASRISPSDPRVREWDSYLPAVHGSLAAPDGFMSPKFDPEAGAIASYSYVRFLMGDASKFNLLMEGLRKGGKFDEQFTAAYKGTPSQKAEQWYARGPKPARPTRSGSKARTEKEKSE